jgi:hypothetical protein
MKRINQTALTGETLNITHPGTKPEIQIAPATQMKLILAPSS